MVFGGRKNQRVHGGSSLLPACSFRNAKDHFNWVFAGVYGTNSDCDRWFLWEESVGLPQIGWISISVTFLVRDWVKPEFSNFIFYPGIFLLKEILLCGRLLV